MTIREAIEQTDALKDNQYTQEQKIGWLSQLDGYVFKEIILTHENDGTPFSGFNSETDPDTELLVPAPYTDVYRWFLESRIDLANGELAKYNNSVSLYNNAYLTYFDYYNRTHAPLQQAAYFKL